jgi:hypothetical protein
MALFGSMLAALLAIAAFTGSREAKASAGKGSRR